jgi:DNA-binding response OmpR family regulator
MLHILLLTDEGDFEASLPALALFTRSVSRVPLAICAEADCQGTDVAVVDARNNLPAARAVCRYLTAVLPSTAVVAVLAAEDFVAVDLDWHVDDMLLTTASAAELYTRLRLAVARRRQAIESRLQFGDLVLHPQRYTASLAGRDLDLTLTEFKLLNFLVQHAGRAFTRAKLMHKVWGHECHRRTVDVHVQRLRAKLGPGYESIIDTVRGVGYMVPSSPHARPGSPLGHRGEPVADATAIAR